MSELIIQNVEESRLGEFWPELVSHLVPSSGRGSLESHASHPDSVLVGDQVIVHPDGHSSFPIDQA